MNTSTKETLKGISPFAIAATIIFCVIFYTTDKDLTRRENRKNIFVECINRGNDPVWCWEMVVD